MSEITPALTPEQWAGLGEHGADEIVMDVLQRPMVGVRSDLELAALCLHGHPQGFTWDDVDLLRALSESLVKANITEWRSVSGLANRIAALLPPREP